MGISNARNADRNMVFQNGSYYFRKIIPKAYHGIMGKKIWTKSLSTSDLKVARGRLKVCRDEYETSISLCISKKSWLKQQFLKSVDNELSGLPDQSNQQSENDISIEVLKRLIQGQLLNNVTDNPSIAWSCPGIAPLL